MTRSSRKFKIGLFVLAFAALSVAAAALLSGRLLFQERATYYVFAPNVEGLEVGSAVKIRGVRVGDVADFQLYGEGGEGVRIVLALDPDARVSSGAKAYLEYAGVTGLRIVNIRGGDAEAGFVEEGGTIHYGQTLLDELPDRASALLERASHVLERTEDLAAGLSGLAASVDPEKVGAALDGVNRLLTDMQETAARANRLLARSEVPVERALSGTESVVERLDATAQSVDATARELRAFVARLDRVVRVNDDEVRATLTSLKHASQSFEALGRELRMRPSRLFFGAAPPERELP